MIARKLSSTWTSRHGVPSLAVLLSLVVQANLSKVVEDVAEPRSQAGAECDAVAQEHA